MTQNDLRALEGIAQKYRTLSKDISHSKQSRCIYAAQAVAVDEAIEALIAISHRKSTQLAMKHLKNPQDLER